MKTYREPKYDILWQVVYWQEIPHTISTGFGPVSFKPVDPNFPMPAYFVTLKTLETVLFESPTRELARGFILEHKISNNSPWSSFYEIRQRRIPQHKYKRGY